MPYREKIALYLKRLRGIKVWQLVVLLLLSALISATFLRLNSLNMSDLRKAVIAADQKGDASAIAKSVNQLGSYVSSHMNTDLGDGFYLSASYDRVRQAAITAAADTTDPSSKIYQQASVECQSASARAPFGGLYVPCVQSRVRDLGGPSNLESELKLPRYETYKVDFVSPLWSPDLAGISVAISAIILLMIVVRLTGVVALRLLLKRRFQHIS